MAKKIGLFSAVIILAVLMLCLFAACTPNEGVEIDDPSLPYANVVAVRINSVKNVCYLGESFDLSDYKVLLELKGGTVVEEVLSSGHATVDADFIDVDEMFFYRIGTTSFSVRYGAAETTYTIEVKEPDVTGAALDRMPNKTEYVEGERLTMDGCRLALKLNTGDTVYAYIGDGFVTGFDSSSLGEKTLKINYAGFVVELKVNVRAKRINGVSVETLPEVRSYVVGETVVFQTAGLRYRINYDNGAYEIVAASELPTETVSYAYDFSKPDSQSPVTATYKDAEGNSYRMTFTVAVSSRQPMSLTIENRPTHYDNIVEGAADMNYAGGTIRIRFTDDPNGEGEVLPMTSPVFYKKGFKNTVGTHTITFSYFNNSLPAWCVTMDVNVKAKSAEALEFADVEGFTNSRYYAVEGKRADINSLLYRIRYDNGEYSPYAAVREDMIAVGGGLTENSLLLTEGLKEWDGTGWTKTVTFEAEGVRNSLPIYVIREIPTSIALTSPPNSTQVQRGQVIDLTGANLRVIFNSGDERNVSDFGVSFTNPDNDPNAPDGFTDRNEGVYTVYAYYLVNGNGDEIKDYVQWREKAGRYQTFTVTVIDNGPTGFSQIDVYPDKTAYLYGDTLSFAGLEVTFDYNDGNGNIVKRTYEVKEVTIAIDGDTEDGIEFTNKDIPSDKVVLRKTDFVMGGETKVYTSGSVALEFLGIVFNFDITVLPLARIQLRVDDASAMKTVYAIGEEFDPSGAIMEVRRNNNTTEFFTPDSWRKIDAVGDAEALGDGWYYVANVGSAAGIKTVTLVYKRGETVLSCNLDNIVYHQNGVTKIALYKGDYLAESLGVVGAGLTPYVGEYTVRAYYSDSEYYTLPLTLDMIDYSAKDLTTEGGNRKVTVSYNGLSIKTYVTVDVNAVLESITVKTLPRTNYIVGEMLNLSGGILTRTYKDGVLPTDEVALSEARVVGYNAEPNFFGPYSGQTLTVEYQGLTTTFDVTVWDKAYPDVTFSSLVKIYGNRQPASVTFVHPNGIFLTPEYRLVYQRFDEASGEWVNIPEEDAPPVSVSGERGYRVRFVSEENRYYYAVAEDAGEEYYARYVVQKATITISANPAEKYYGDKDPVITFSASQQELWDSAVKEVAASGSITSAGLTSSGDGSEKDAGTYTIERGDLDHPYFNIEFRTANYLIMQKEVEVSLPALQNMRLIKENGTAQAQSVATAYRLVGFNAQGRKVYTEASREQKASIDAAMEFKYEKLVGETYTAVAPEDVKEIGSYRVTIYAKRGANYSVSEDSANFVKEENSIVALFEIKKMTRPSFTVTADNVTLTASESGGGYKVSLKNFEYGFDNLLIQTLSGTPTEVHADGSTDIEISSNDVLRFTYAETEEYEASTTATLYVTVPTN